ncbi:hypothetical protein BKA62DRAFT_831077 [Auriculariales sp. MPI-PUGE-AT-0066]|nr:hypothetical protein BKA62DRAFT_831077 [Auriculariales sp. MPI-PUGE-AT-0066]
MAFNEEDIWGRPMDARGGDLMLGKASASGASCRTSLQMCARLTPPSAPDRLNENCIQAGFREGIVVGKEAALQDGFDHGFEHSGVPAGRQLGLLRGQASAALAIITKLGRMTKQQKMHYGKSSTS